MRANLSGPISVDRGQTLCKVTTHEVHYVMCRRKAFSCSRVMFETLHSTVACMKYYSNMRLAQASLCPSAVLGSSSRWLYTDQPS